MSEPERIAKRLARAGMCSRRDAERWIEAGRVKLPTTAPWLDDLRSELAAFPFGRHDDQVDSVSQFLGWVTTRVQIPSVAPFSVPREDDYSW